MEFGFATFAAVFLLFAAASCAPAGLSLQDGCEDLRQSSMELNLIAKNVSAAARNGSKDVTNFSTSLVWMEAKDKCGPVDLKRDPATCIGKIFNALTRYESTVKMLHFSICSEFASKVMPALQKLHTDMTRCGKSSGELKHQDVSHTTIKKPGTHWQEALLCRYTMDRLFSFSILVARVFAVGDPAHHAKSSVQNCTEHQMCVC